MKQRLLFVKISNWFKRFFSRNKQKSEDTRDEALGKVIKNQLELQKRIEEQKGQQAESSKKIADYTYQLLKKNEELINEANKK